MTRGAETTENFNPRLREGGDAVVGYSGFVYYISIHASAKEATVGDYYLKCRLNISIHASAKEATLD